MTEVPEFVARRLNSIMKQVIELDSKDKTPAFGQVEIIWNAYYELHQNINENMEPDGFFPKYTAHDAGYSYILLEIIKTRIREIADYFSLTLDVDQKEESTPMMVQNQQQTSTQINMQSINNVIECINSLDVKWEQKQKLVDLTNKFEKAATEKDYGKLKTILKKVAEISPKVVGFLMEHASEIGILTSLL